MVTTVIDGSANDDYSYPQPGYSQVRASNDWSTQHRGQVHHIVLSRVAVDGDYTNRSCPLMVCLVNELVETRVVEQPE